jgi:orotidine-5'-phosphate decarboxylase
LRGKEKMKARDRLIVALDVDTLEKAVELVDILSPEVEIFKVGIAPFTDFGPEILATIEKYGKKVFLDLKFHDIPNTVRNAACVASKKGVFMMNFHCLGGRKMLEAAARGCGETCAAAGNKKPITLGVTVLTSMADADLAEAGIEGPVEKRVLALAALAKASGLDGVVASAKEAKLIKKELGKNFIVVTPGVRPAWAEEGDQKRVLTPKQAIAEGADYIVVGRPIIEAEDPFLAAKRIIEEMES